jgi:hypothetical protein
MTSARVCPDWLELMEIDLKLQFKHYSALEAHATVETLGAPDRHGSVSFAPLRPECYLSSRVSPVSIQGE